MIKNIEKMKIIMLNTWKPSNRPWFPTLIKKSKINLVNEIRKEIENGK